MYKFLVQLYKRIALSAWTPKRVLVEKVSWFKREAIFAGIMALSLITVLGAISYLLFPQTTSQLKTRTPATFAFSLIGGDLAYESPTIENQTIRHDTADWLQLEFEFTFANGSSIHEPNVPLPEGETGVIRPEYYGESDAETLQRIYVKLFHFGIVAIPENVSLEVSKNTTISVVLKATEVFNLGVYKCLNERKTITGYPKGFEVEIGSMNRSYSGSWKPNPMVDAEDWAIDVDQLTSMLQGNGTALVTFDATINVTIRYEMIDENVESGEITLSPWEGRIGTIEIVYEQSKITWIRYSFSKASLILLTTSQ